MNAIERMVAEKNLQTCLDLWLSAIKQGDYAGAKKVLEWRTALRQKLQTAGSSRG